MIRLQLDADVDVLLARRLREEGYDIVAAVDAAMHAASDEEQLTYADSERRTLLTFNVRHFAPLHNEWNRLGKMHWGIVVSRQYRRQEIGVLLHAVRRLLDLAIEEDLRSRLRHLSEFNI